MPKFPAVQAPARAHAKVPFLLREAPAGGPVAGDNDSSFRHGADGHCFGGRLVWSTGDGLVSWEWDIWPASYTAKAGGLVIWPASYTAKAGLVIWPAGPLQGLVNW